MYGKKSALAQYQKINKESEVNGASPHRLIQLLMEGALSRLAQAKSALEKEDIPTKGLLLGKTISILSGLQASLDKKVGGETADGLDKLYDYMQRRLLEANMKNDIDMIDEVAGLLSTVKTGWDEIAPAA